MISIEMALRIVDVWLKSPFEGGRHAGRLEQLARYEAGQPMR
jgi:ribose 5-phosphate isomerase RpiB